MNSMVTLYREETIALVRRRWCRLVCVVSIILFAFAYNSFRLDVFWQGRKTGSRVIRILCFGDSLTEGYSTITRTRHPYTNKLQKLLEKLRYEHSKKVVYEVHNHGISGERVEDEMTQRLPRILEGKITFDWVVILGGTNDVKRILWTDYDQPVNISSISQNLLKLHSFAHTRGARTVALTLPAFLCEVETKCKEVKQSRLKINNILRAFADGSNGKVVVADIANKIEFPKFRELWADQLHFNEEGYDRMADVVFESLKFSL